MVKPTNKGSSARNTGETAQLGTFPKFFALHYRYLLKCCVKILGNIEDAEEVVQETFMRYHLKGQEFRGDSSLRTYLYRIAVNLCINQIRKSRSKKSTPLHLCRDIEDAPMPERELIWTVERTLRALKPSLRIPLVLHEMEGMNCREIGDVLEITESCVRSRIFRAKKRLKSMLEREGISEGAFE